MKRMIPGILLAGMTAMGCFAQKDPSERIDSFLLVLEQHQLFNGSVLIARHGQVIYERSAGYLDRERKISNSDTACFNLASLSKPFTSVAVLQLVQRGRIGLDDPFIKYFPDFPYPEVSIRHLLSHTAGLPQMEAFERSYVDAHSDEVLTNAEVYAHLVALKSPLAFAPGSAWAYSNLGYGCLALLVEKVSRMPFADYMKKYVFLPAGMNRSYIRGARMPNTPRYIIPTMYEREYQPVDSLDHKKINTYYNLGGIAGPNNVMSTLEDLLQFDRALWAGKLISLSLLQQAIAPTVLSNGKTVSLGGKRSYGFGWNVIADPAEDTVVFHDGHIIGIGTMLFKNLSSGITILYYDNNDSPYPFQKIGTMARILQEKPLVPIPLTRSLARAYGQALISRGVDYASVLFDEMRKDSSHYHLRELEVNDLGYDLLSRASVPNHLELACEVFKVNALLFHSSNSYDSYADALARNGKKEEAERVRTLIDKPAGRRP